jgi:hypothetical protein
MDSKFCYECGKQLTRKRQKFCDGCGANQTAERSCQAAASAHSELEDVELTTCGSGRSGQTISGKSFVEMVERGGSSEQEHGAVAVRDYSRNQTEGYWFQRMLFARSGNEWDIVIFGSEIASYRPSVFKNMAQIFVGFIFISLPGVALFFLTLWSMADAQDANKGQPLLDLGVHMRKVSEVLLYASLAPSLLAGTRVGWRGKNDTKSMAIIFVTAILVGFAVGGLLWLPDPDDVRDLGGYNFDCSYNGFLNGTCDEDARLGDRSYCRSCSQSSELGPESCGPLLGAPGAGELNNGCVVFPRLEGKNKRTGKYTTPGKFIPMLVVFQLFAMAVGAIVGWGHFGPDESLGSALCNLCCRPCM